MLSLSSLSCCTCGASSEPNVAVAIKQPPFSPLTCPLSGGVIGCAFASPTAISNETTFSWDWLKQNSLQLQNPSYIPSSNQTLLEFLQNQVMYVLMELVQK